MSARDPGVEDHDGWRLRRRRLQVERTQLGGGYVLEEPKIAQFGRTELHFVNAVGRRGQGLQLRRREPQEEVHLLGRNELVEGLHGPCDAVKLAGDLRAAQFGFLERASIAAPACHFEPVGTVVDEGLRAQLRAGAVGHVGQANVFDRGDSLLAGAFGDGLARGLVCLRDHLGVITEGLDLFAQVLELR